MSLLNRKKKLYSDSSTSIYDSESSTYFKGNLLKSNTKKKKSYDNCESSSTVYRDKYVQVECEMPKKYRDKNDNIVEERKICMTESNLRSRRTETLEVLSVDTYSLDTDIIRWKPRLINVPSEEYKNLDQAICALKPR